MLPLDNIWLLATEGPPSLAIDLSPNKGKKFLSSLSNMIVTVEFVHRKDITDIAIPLGKLFGTVISHSQTNSERDDAILGMSEVKLYETGKNPVPYDEVLLPFENMHAIILPENGFLPPITTKEKSCSGNPTLYNAVRSNTQVLINTSNNDKFLGRVKSCEDNLGIFLEDVKEMWTEGSTNKDRYVSKMLLSFESIILVVSNPAGLRLALAHKSTRKGEDHAVSNCVQAMHSNDFLTDLVGKSVRIKLIAGQEYQGVLASYSITSSQPPLQIFPAG